MQLILAHKISMFENHSKKVNIFQYYCHLRASEASYEPGKIFFSAEKMNLKKNMSETFEENIIDNLTGFTNT